jgi:hypothetical protein
VKWLISQSLPGRVEYATSTIEKTGDKKKVNSGLYYLGIFLSMLIEKIWENIGESIKKILCWVNSMLSS